MNDPAKAGMGTTCTVVLFAGRDKAVWPTSATAVSIWSEAKISTKFRRPYLRQRAREAWPPQEERSPRPPAGQCPLARHGGSAQRRDRHHALRYRCRRYLLLCSDGLYNYYPEAKELIPTLKDGDIRQSLGTLVNTAKERGGHDNITGVVIRIKTGEIPVAAAERLKILKKIAIFSHLQHLELMKVLGTAQMAKVNKVTTSSPRAKSAT